MAFARVSKAAGLALLTLAAGVTPTWAVGEQAIATLKLSNGNEAGTVTFTEGTAGVLLKFDLKGLPAGAHAVHIHEAGVCDGDFESAGGIYNPLGAKHGYLHDEGPMAGDLPNIYAAADGSVVAEMLSPFITLSTAAEESLFDSNGAAIVVQEKPDDYEAEPDGGAGARIGCGVISIKK